MTDLTTYLANTTVAGHVADYYTEPPGWLVAAARTGGRSWGDYTAQELRALAGEDALAPEVCAFARALAILVELDASADLGEAPSQSEHAAAMREAESAWADWRDLALGDE